MDNPGLIIVTAHLQQTRSWDWDRDHYQPAQFFNKIRRKPLKGKKRVRLDTRTSDWLKYTGSSKALNAVMEQYITHIETLSGNPINDLDTVLEKRFTFDILSLHVTKFQLSYAENRLIYVTDAMIDEKYYNCFTSRLGNKKDFA